MEDTAPSFRGLEDGYRAIPVTHFKGRLESFNTEMRTNITPAKEYVNLLFTELDIIETSESYVFPILQLSFPRSKRKQSGWGVFAESGIKLLTENEDFPDLVGKYLECKLTPGHMMWDSTKGEETPRDCWEIISTSSGDTKRTGKGPSALDEALRILDGKSEADFNQEAFKNETIKAGGLITSILDNTESGFLASMISTGRITKDENGVFHVKEA